MTFLGGHRVIFSNRGIEIAPNNYKSSSGLICFAHRGASGHEPENTLLSVEKAISLGAQWIEIDVYAVEDELVVIHDETLERTTNGKGFVANRSLEYLRSLDAGKGQKIPLLKEVFNLVDNRAGINVELKGPNTASPVTALIHEYIKNHNLTFDRIIVSSFNHDELKKVKAFQPDINIGVLISSIPEHFVRVAENVGAYSVHISKRSVNKQFVDDAHERGIKVFVYTVNSGEDVALMQSLGVDGIFTDYPEILSLPGSQSRA
ncbi:MAG: glycerophosphodiester phosphodiesterase [bacterium]